MYKMLKQYGIKPWEVSLDGNVYQEDVAAIKQFIKYEDALSERKRHEGEREARLSRLRKKAGWA
jgi:hypothetical protein